MAHLLIRCASLAVERLSPAVFAKDPSRGGEWPPQRRVRVQDVPRMSVTMSTWWPSRIHGSVWNSVGVWSATIGLALLVDALT